MDPRAGAWRRARAWRSTDVKLVVPREVHAGERRVAATPDTTARLIKLGFEVLVETEAGAGASFGDDDYQAAGARIVGDARSLWAEADVVLKVQPPEQHLRLGVHEVDLLKPGATIISFLWPGKNKELVERLNARKVTALAVDSVPRITRAQKLDALSSMANIAGYRAVIEAASFYGRFFTGQMTAAGRVPPAKVFVIGAGVAGLSAIGTARCLGAIVRAFDTRPSVKDQVTSMGAEFIEIQMEGDEGEGGYAKEMTKEYHDAEVAMLAQQAKDVDIIVTTALIPNKPAPVLITEDMVKSMKKGSVIVDLAAENGGNCQCTRPGEVTKAHGVTIIGYVDFPSRLAPTASQLYGSNLVHLLTDMGGAAGWKVDLEDEVVRGAIVVHQGQVLWPAPKKPAPPAPAASKATAKPVVNGAHGAHDKPGMGKPSPGVMVLLGLLAVGLLWLSAVAPTAFIAHLTVFALACVIGYQVIWSVTPALHTPLMSVTNAISGIIVVGGMLQVGGPLSSPPVILGALAILLASINIAGG
ncbi:MAG: Re/Si-specific NAD(P)(+) transhydrogenase subunit alpha, partial [Gemmatimonadetes bacterium]|nr:Re/Si-specific NAD(P)(+) transhydrogenase subunit alpha [Gemmatimonadota bacterium]